MPKTKTLKGEQRTGEPGSPAEMTSDPAITRTHHRGAHGQVGGQRAPSPGLQALQTGHHNLREHPRDHTGLMPFIPPRDTLKSKPPSSSTKSQKKGQVGVPEARKTHPQREDRTSQEKLQEEAEKGWGRGGVKQGGAGSDLVLGQGWHPEGGVEAGRWPRVPGPSACPRERALP